MTVLIIVGMIILAPPVMNRFGAKALIVTGLAILAVGLGRLALIRPDGNYWADVLPASLIVALGMSLAFVPSLGTAISSARPEEGGLAIMTAAGAVIAAITLSTPHNEWREGASGGEGA